MIYLIAGSFPLEGRVDYLTLHTGKKIEVPFEQLIDLRHYLDPQRLVDDAFCAAWVTVSTSIHGPGDVHAIFQHSCKTAASTTIPASGILFRLYDTDKRPLRGCEPRDLIHVRRSPVSMKIARCFFRTSCFISPGRILWRSPT